MLAIPVPALSQSELTCALSLTRCNLTSVMVPSSSVCEKAVSSLALTHYLGELLSCHA